MRAGRQHEIGFGDQIDHFVIWQEIARVEIDPAGPVPDDDLAHRKAGHDILPVLQQALLDPPGVVVENRPVRPQQPHHLGKAGALPGHIAVMRHGIAMGGISFEQGSASPFAAPPVAQAVARTVAQIIGRRGDNAAKAGIRETGHDVKAITVKKRATGRATGCLEQGMKMIGC